MRHEQSAAFMGQAYSRLLQKPSVCMAASGPGVINLTTGIAYALIDCCPVVAVGGSSPIGQNGRQVFQEIDQLAIMKPCTEPPPLKWSDLNDVIWPQGGPIWRGRDTSLKRLSRSCGR